MARPDPHSFAETSQPQTKSIELSLRLDFEAQAIEGEVALHFHAPGQGPIDLDTRDLRIFSVTALSGAPLPFALAPPAPILGARLRIELPEGSAGLRVKYATARQATALQWLSPAQTAGGAQPFLFSQCQPIHARSVIPLQDTPAVRITVTSARFDVPARLRTLMAAAFQGRELHGDRAVDRFEMPQPIPPYLLAFAVGDLVERPLSPRCSVWAEPSVAGAAAHEFAEVERMLAAAEQLFGPYEWQRYDVLVMPPSFPYGGMENPRLTFVTPSLLAGDRSLANVIAHELAHAWTGNLVTNASANDFWLNEGFTVYAERRILEALEGRALSELHAAIGRHDLEASLQRFAHQPELTLLRTALEGLDPDEAYSNIPYEKGYLFLRRLEELGGRAQWDAFLRAYLSRFRFQSITTGQFLDFLEERLPGLAARARALEWIDQPGLPADAPRPQSAQLRELQALAAAGRLPEGELTPIALLVYLQALPASLSAEALQALDARFALSSRQSLELRHTFVLAALRAGLPGAVEAARRVALETGRMKYLRPIYQQLAKSDRAAAERIFAEACDGYHHIARAVVGGLLR